MDIAFVICSFVWVAFLIYREVTNHKTNLALEKRNAWKDVLIYKLQKELVSEKKLSLEIFRRFESAGLIDEEHKDFIPKIVEALIRHQSQKQSVVEPNYVKSCKFLNIEPDEL